MSSGPCASLKSWILWSKKAQNLSWKSLVGEPHGSPITLTYLTITKDQSPCFANLSIIECTLATTFISLIAKSNICKSRK
jgi:hypothetical protein